MTHLRHSAYLLMWQWRRGRTSFVNGGQRPGEGETNSMNELRPYVINMTIYICVSCTEESDTTQRMRRLSLAEQKRGVPS